MGHWFLTPDYQAKEAYCVAVLEGKASPDELVQVIRREGINYLLVPPVTPQTVVEAIQPLVKKVVQIKGFTLLYTRMPPITDHEE